MIRLATYLLLMSFSYLMASGLPASAEEGARDYTGIFDGLDLTQSEIDYLKQWDRFAFASESDRYVGLGRKYHDGRQDYIYNYYASGFPPGAVSVMINERRLHSVLRGLLPGKSPNESDIVIIGISEPVSIMPDPVEDEEGVTHEVLLDDHDSCKIVRTSKDYVVTGTAILVQVGSIPEMPQEELLRMFSCINRGHLFHFGFSGVKSLPAESFAAYKPNSKSISLPSDRSILAPRFMHTGNLNGLDRRDVLRQLAESYSAEDK